MDIGEKIKRMRIEKQLTQEELANRCELSKGFISQLENYDNFIKLVIINREILVIGGLYIDIR